MATELMEQRGIRTINLKLDLHKDLMKLKADEDAESLSSLVGKIYNIYMRRKKRLEEKKLLEERREEKKLAEGIGAPE